MDIGQNNPLHVHLIGYNIIREKRSSDNSDISAKDFDGFINKQDFGNPCIYTMDDRLSQKFTVPSV